MEKMNVLINCHLIQVGFILLFIYNIIRHTIMTSNRTLKLRRAIYINICVHNINIYPVRLASLKTLDYLKCGTL